MANESTGTKDPIPVIMTDDNGNPLHPRVFLGNVCGTLPVSKGGTGINKLTGSKLIASSESGDFFEEIDIDVKSISERLHALRTYDVDVDVNNWISSSDGYINEIPVAGITGEDNPIVSLLAKSDEYYISLATEVSTYAKSAYESITDYTEIASTKATEASSASTSAEAETFAIEAEEASTNASLLYEELENTITETETIIDNGIDAGSDYYKSLLEAYSTIDKVVTSEDSIILFAYDSIPTKTFSIKLICTGS